MVAGSSPARPTSSEVFLAPSPTDSYNFRTVALMSVTKETAGTGSVTDMWVDRHGKPKPAATGAFAAGTSKKPQGKGKRWRAYYVGSDGIRKYQSFALKDDAQAWVSSRCAEVNEGRWVSPSMGTGTFGEIARKWLATQIPVEGADGRWSGPIEPKTYTDYEGLLRLFALPKWGEVPIRNIDYPGLTDWYSQLRKNGKRDGGPLSPSRMKRLHVVMHRVFNYAMKAGLAQTDPTALIEPRKDLPRKAEAKRPVALTHGELQSLAEEMGELEVMTLVIGYCGLRISEAVGLKRKHVVGQALHLEEVTTYATGFGLHDKGTKSHRRRTVPIPDPIWEVFKPTLPTSSEDYVFPFNDEQMRDHNYSHRMEKAVERMQERVNQQREKEIGKTGQAVTREFPRITPHDLRDTFASLAIQCGANVKVLQRLLGHADAAVTLNTYAEFFPDDIDSVAKALSAAITLRTSNPFGRV